MLYTFINYCAKVNIYFESTNFFGKKLHFFTKKDVLIRFLCIFYPIFTEITLIIALSPVEA